MCAPVPPIALAISRLCATLSMLWVMYAVSGRSGGPATKKPIDLGILEGIPRAQKATARAELGANGPRSDCLHDAGSGGKLKRSA